MRAKPGSPNQAADTRPQEIESEAVPSQTDALAIPSARLEQRRKRQKLPRRRKRLRLSEAMRAQGINEQMIAEAYAGVVINLRETGKGEGKEKVLVDVLKECTKALADKTGREAGPIAIQLVHHVPRPVRNTMEPSNEESDQK